MSTLDVVAEILREVAPRALNAKQIVELANGRLPTASRTPETVVSRDLAIEVKRNETRSRFLRVDRGEFVLKEALPTAFYNDVEPYAAAWTRNLIEAGELAPGVVDERSIRDLKPVDVASYRQFHAFSGIGIWSRALRDAGVPDDFNVWSGSPPCQPWSSAGQRKGHADDRDLWPEWYRLIAACRPACVIGEQVSSKDGLAWVDVVRADLEGANYSFRVLDTPAACIGAPHRRARLYYVAYARERGCQILSAPWLHDRWQPRHDAARRCPTDIGDAVSLSDDAGARSCVTEDPRADRGDEIEGAEAIERGPAWDLEFERGRDEDGTRALSDTERFVWNEGRIDRPHGREEIEPDRYGEDGGLIGGFGGEAGGNRCDCIGTIGMGAAGREGSQGGISGTRGRHGLASASAVDDETVGMGDAGLARGGRDAGAVPRAEGVGEGERIEARNLADELVAPGADDEDARPLVGVAVNGDECADGETCGMVRGATDVAGDGSDLGTVEFRPGDRIRIDGDPSWGGAVRGHWAKSVEWIYCRPEPGHQDGRWRPVGPGIEPLVNGNSPGMGRTRAKRLRCLGNAIVLPLATAFVEAVIDSFAEAALSLAPAPAVEPEPASVPVVEPAPIAWTGPRAGETAPSGMLYGRVPGDRWPYGPPNDHQPICNLFPQRGSPGGLFCDCALSAVDDVAHGVVA